MRLICILAAHGYRRGSLLNHIDKALYRDNLIKSTDLKAVDFVANFADDMKQFCYNTQAPQLAENLGKSMQILFIIFREIHGPTLTDEMEDEICKELEQEIVALACLWALMGWTEKQIEDALVSLLKNYKNDKNDFLD